MSCRANLGQGIRSLFASFPFLPRCLIDPSCLYFGTYASQPKTTLKQSLSDFIPKVSKHLGHSIPERPNTPTARSEQQHPGTSPPEALETKTPTPATPDPHATNPEPEVSTATQQPKHIWNKLAGMRCTAAGGSV